ncbi:MAG TPA: oligosaccharide flippase family protein [Steroidobacter sp.]
MGIAVAGAGSTWVMARHMSVAQFGRVAFVLAVVNAVAVLDGLRRVVIFQANRGEVDWSTLYQSARRIAVLTGAAVFALVFATALLVPALQVSVLESLTIAATMALYFKMALFWAFLDADGHTAYTGAWRGVLWIGTYGAFACFALLRAPFIAYLSALLCMNIALIAVYYLRLGREHRLSSAPAQSVRIGWLYRLALDNIRFNVSAVIMGVADRLAIGGVLGSGQVALYSAPYEFATKPVALVRAIAQVLYPRAVTLSDSQVALSKEWLRLSAPIVALAITSSVIVIYFRTPLVLALLGPKYLVSADIFGVIAMAFWMVTLGYAANVYLNANGDFVTQRRWYGWAAAIMVSGLYPILHWWGIVGAACLYTFVRGVDLVLGILVLRAVRPQLVFAASLTLAAAFVSLAGAWIHSPMLTLIGLASLWTLIWRALRADN